MKRRDFGKSIAAGVIGVGIARASLPEIASARKFSGAKKNTLMHVGADYHNIAGSGITSKENLEYNLRFGVNHISVNLGGPESVSGTSQGSVRQGGGASGLAGQPRGAFFSAEGPAGGAWDLDQMKKMKDDCDRAGMIWEAVRMDSGYIVMRAGPERDRKLDQMAENIHKASEVGVGIITYHWTLIPIRRNGEAPGRGGSSYVTFKLEDDWKDLPVESAGRVTSDDYWERITTFLEKTIPVAKEYNVKMAAHPYDPPGLPFGYQGADNWDSPSIFDGIKRYEAIVDSPYNGFQLDMGVLSEGSKDPAKEVPPIVQYLAERGKIHQIHMRNIRGGLNDFAEVYPDEGALDYLVLMRILRDAQYPGGILPDHMPRHPDDPRSLQGYAFGYGYLAAMIHAANTEVASG